jgi:hypothetical protein
VDDDELAAPELEVAELDGVEELVDDSDLAAVDSDEPLELVPLACDSLDDGVSVEDDEDSFEPLAPFAPARESVR